MSHYLCAQMTIRVAIVEDTADIRQGLAFLINSSPGLECVSACGAAEEALEKIPNLVPQVILMDIGLPGMSGIECIRKLKATCPALQVMMLTIFEDDERIFEALAAGADGYLLKKTPPAKIVEAILDLHAGGAPMSAPIARRLLREFQTPPATNDRHGLTDREWQILSHLADGLLYKEIAEKTSLSIHTVRTHIHRIYEKLHVRTRTEAVMKTFGRP
jgi:DNA-binding NarL/FixJ family response regulator